MYLKLVSQSTLEQLHDYWTWYAESAQSSPALKDRVLAEMTRVVGAMEGLAVGSAARSAGPLWLHATAPSNDAYRQWWSTGLTSSDEAQVKAAVHLNPTFAYSAGREGFFTHSDSAPIMAFHLAAAYTASDSSSQSEVLERTVEDLYRAARSQFQGWCEAYRATVASEQKITLRFACCDFVSLCSTFGELQDTGNLSAFHRINPWSGRLFSLYVEDGSSYGGPTTFDVIDTSSLCDHAGMTNVLLAASFLLKHTPWATFYTETLLQTGDDPTRGITKSLCGELSATAMLFDLVPVPYMSGFETHSNVHECLAIRMFGNGDQYYERLAWKRPSQLARPLEHNAVSFEPTQLAALLFNMYLEMFTYEGASGMLGGPRISATLIRDKSRVHYCRRTLALLIHDLKRRVATDWDSVVDHFLRKVENDRTLIIGMVGYQDLLCQLHLLGIYSADTFKPGPFLSSNRNGGPFTGWSPIPPAVCIVFSVPRATVARLNRADVPPNVPLTASIAGPSFDNRFCYLETFHGTLSVSGRGDSAVGVVTDDPRGVDGSAPWIVSFWARPRGS